LSGQTVGTRIVRCPILVRGQLALEAHDLRVLISFAPGAWERHLTRANQLSLLLVELVPANAQVDRQFRRRTLARIEQAHRLALEFRRESLPLDHLTPPKGLSPLKGVRQTRASSAVNALTTNPFLKPWITHQELANFFSTIFGP